MTEEQIEREIEAVEDEANEPIYYKPKTLSLIASIAAWFSWVVLVVFILVIAAKVAFLMSAASQGGTTIMQMITDANQGSQVRIFIYDNIIIPLFTGASFFVLLQAASVGLNALLEIDFNVRDLQA